MNETDPSRTLVVECASEACSVALFENTKLVANEHVVLGRGHAERLVPMIANLPDKGRAGRILVSLGPGSFTGVRIGVAAARALGVAWGAQVLGYPTLSLIAARSWQPTPRPVTVCMNGGHGEWFIQNFANSSQAQDDVRSLPPEEAAEQCKHYVIAGNRANELAAVLGDNRLSLDLMPDASSAYLLNDKQLTDNLALIYGREPDAKLPQAKAPSA